MNSHELKTHANLETKSEGKCKKWKLGRQAHLQASISVQMQWKFLQEEKRSLESHY